MTVTNSTLAPPSKLDILSAIASRCTSGQLGLSSTTTCGLPHWRRRRPLEVVSEGDDTHRDTAVAVVAIHPQTHGAQSGSGHHVERRPFPSATRRTAAAMQRTPLPDISAIEPSAL